MKKVLLDCDPGHDDALAIGLACASEQVELLGITTVAGNQTGDKTLLNALKVLSLLGRKVPVARGFDKPLLRELVTAPEIHGVSGLDGADLPPPRFDPLPVHAVEFLIHTLRSSPDKIYLVPTGPLTNVAVALVLAPDVRDKIERIVLMGGGIRDVNVTPAAEFNIYVDPEAARIVFRSGVPLTMVGLDATHKALWTCEDVAALERLGGRVSRTFAQLLRFFVRANEEAFGFPGAPLHDPLAVAAVVDPTLIRTTPVYVDVETQGDLTRGATVADVYRVTGKPPNAEVALDLDLPRFKELVIASFRALDRAV